MKQKTILPIILSLFILAVIASCSKTGPAGPTGPAGSQGVAGQQGPKGVPGTANVMYSAWDSSFSGTSATLSAPAITA